MKKCSKCKQLLSVEMFAKDKTRNDGLNVNCKQCKKQYYTANWEKYHKVANIQLQRHKLSHHIVYLLPDHNYVGVTNRPYFRMSSHKFYNNRNTSNWIELARYENRKDALKCEAEYHAKGYEGSGKTKVVD